MRRLVAPGCVLEPQVAAHAREMFDVLSDPAIYEFENAPPSSHAWLEQRYARLESRTSADGTERWLNWVIRIADGSLAGYVQATILPTGVAFVAYELASRHWRQGIGSAAVTALVEALRTDYGVHTCVAVLKARNYRSEGLLRKCGFVPASGEELQTYRDEPDEAVMVRSALTPP